MSAPDELDTLREALTALRELGERDSAALEGTAERLRILASTMEQCDRVADAEAVLLASRVLDAVAREGVPPHGPDE